MAQILKPVSCSIKISVVLLALLVQLTITIATTTTTNSTTSPETIGANNQLEQHNDLKQQVQTTIETRPARRRAPAASGRSGRMLDLDVLAGDIGKQEKAAKERSLTGNRQSRKLAPTEASAQGGGPIDERGATQSVEGRSPLAKKTTNKKMSIKGFIPIVSLENGKHFDPSQLLGSDADSDSDSGSAEDESGSDTDPSGGQQSEQQANNLREHLANNYGGQTSLGHASFAPTTNSNQRQQQQQSQYSSVEPQWQQMVASQQQQQQQQYAATPAQDQMQSAPMEVGRANRKLLATSNILSGLTGTAKRGFVSSLVPSAIASSSSNFAAANQYQQQQQQQQAQQQLMGSHLSGPMNLPPVQAPFASLMAESSSQGAADCICVPFFQCKNGYLSESQLSKSQLALMNQLQPQLLPQLLPQPSPIHQIPRSLSSFKSFPGLHNQQAAAAAAAAAVAYNVYPSQQQQSQILADNQVQQLHQQQQQLQQQQQSGLSHGQQMSQQAGGQQQYVNDLIYDQLRKSIESSNLEQQLQQQEAYNEANQQQLALIDERHAKTTAGAAGAAGAAASNSSSSESGASESEERSLLNSLGNRRQYQTVAQKCGIMRTCCRIPPRPTRGTSSPSTYGRPPTIGSAAARFVNAQQQANQLIASPSISRPQNHYQLIQPMRQQQQAAIQAAPQSQVADFSYQLGSGGQNQMSDAGYQQQQQQPMRPNVPASVQSSGGGSFMQGRCGMRQTLGISGRVQNSDSQQLASGETTAEFGEFPAHAAILKRLSPGDSLFVCSAVLISSQWLATAAHCVRKSRPDELKVRLGEWDVNRDDEFYPFFESNVREIVLHPDFQPSSLINDIALIRIEHAVDQQQMPHIAPACLATPTGDSLDPHQHQHQGGVATFQFNGQRCWVTGWGKDAFGQQGAFQSVLKKVDLPVVSHQDCELALKYQTKLGKHFRLHSSNICAGGERGKDACEGDGGAGLYCLDPTSGLSKAVGLVSWGVGCGQRGVPGVYVNLAHFSGWIESVVVSSGEENVYLDSRMNGADLQAFKNIISERSNQELALNGTAAAAMSSTTTTTTPMPPPTTTTTTTMETIMIDEARSANGTHAQ